MKKEHLSWLCGGVVFWGLMLAFGANIINHTSGHPPDISILKSLIFYGVATVVLTLAFQELIGGFISEWPPFTWFFWPLAGLMATGISFLWT